jgi:hypothetical protein
MISYTKKTIDQLTALPLQERDRQAAIVPILNQYLISKNLNIRMKSYLSIFHPKKSHMNSLHVAFFSAKFMQQHTSKHDEQSSALHW